MLGGEQSGFINEIGCETYQKILAEAIDELKEKEFKDLYADSEKGPKQFVKEVMIDTDFELLFPDDYINNIKERLSLYQKLNILKTEEELQIYQNELIDRFGNLPIPAADLLDSIRIKWLAREIGLERIIMKNGRMTGYFINDKESYYYQSPVFGKVLGYVQQQQGQVNIKEKQTRNGLRLLLKFKQIDSVQQAHAALLNILQPATV